ncbi:hypothetical protein FOMPIDRAFT_1020609 [Fomitopsis schrenkii]|uniref:Uncharacterized protein n=1 Tax=Fomitopsis schrenkii TaxID=2126942 RepID=S8F380_FOMSC|nr:hypothetical protein FOMPIDRAFT_1020609 [Fomitopsis schrenkii]
MSAPPCPCVPTYVVGNRYKLPLGRNVVDKATMKKHGGLMKGTDVDFGSHGFSIQDLVDTPIHVLSSIIPDKEFKPFQWYAISPGMVFPVEMKIHWPNHASETHFEAKIPLKVPSGADISRAELAQWIAHAVQSVIYSCRESYTGDRDEHCCWLVGMDNDPYGLTARDVYLVALEHIEAYTFIPVLHVQPSRPPFTLPMRMPNERKLRNNEGAELNRMLPVHEYRKDSYRRPRLPDRLVSKIEPGAHQKGGELERMWIPDEAKASRNNEGAELNRMLPVHEYRKDSHRRPRLPDRLVSKVKPGAHQKGGELERMWIPDEAKAGDGRPGSGSAM